jgi:hypothetical protein
MYSSCSIPQRLGWFLDETHGVYEGQGVEHFLVRRFGDYRNAKSETMFLTPLTDGFTHLLKLGGCFWQAHCTSRSATQHQ